MEYKYLADYLFYKKDDIGIEQLLSVTYSIKFALLDKKLL